MAEKNPYQSPEAEINDEKPQTTVAARKDLNGIRGWLILVAIGVVVAPIKIIAQIYPVYAQILTDGTWEALTTPGTESYSPYWFPILSGEIVVNIVMVVVSIYIATLFFTKSRLLPRWYIGLLVFTMVFIIIDAFAIRLVYPTGEIFDAQTLKEFARTVIASFIWIPYMLVSKRVKATFVN